MNRTALIRISRAGATLVMALVLVPEFAYAAVSDPRSRLFTALVHLFVFWRLRTEVLADVPIWSRERFVARAALRSVGRRPS
jgi:hypothetical protein